MAFLRDRRLVLIQELSCGTTYVVEFMSGQSAVLPKQGQLLNCPSLQPVKPMGLIPKRCRVHNDAGLLLPLNRVKNLKLN
jgi:hypothetical protein